MKCAKSVKVKKRASASGSCGTGLSGWRPASSATIRGDADPTWCTCSSALGRPATKALRSGRGGARRCSWPVSVPDAGPPTAARRLRAGTRWRGGPRPGRQDRMTRPDLWPRRTERLELRPPTDADLDAVLAWRNHPDVNRWLLRTRGRPDGVPGGVAVRRPTTRSTTRSSPSRDGAVVGTLSLEVGDGMGQGPDSPARGERGPARLPRSTPPTTAAATPPRWCGPRSTSPSATSGCTASPPGCFADNVASWRVMEKAGMRREQHGIRDSWHAELGWVDGYTYAVLADERG